MRIGAGREDAGRRATVCGPRIRGAGRGRHGGARAAQGDGAIGSYIERVAPSVERWRWKETIGHVRKIEENHRAMGGKK
jgi:hypothetical protein